MKGSDVSKPCQSFEEACFPQEMLELMIQGFTEPTAIQFQSWPIALSGKDLLGYAHTGPRKTLAYLLPAAAHIVNQKPLEKGDGPIVLILAPKNESVQQIQTIANMLERANIRNTCIFDYDATKVPQAQNLEREAEIVIATPGGLFDSYQHDATNLSHCTYLVLDEVDRMLNIGYERILRSIIKQIRPNRQILMWSKTFSPNIQRFAEEFLKDYIQINNIGLELANHNIRQVVHVIHDQEKYHQLFTFLDKACTEPGFKVVIFVETRKKVDDIAVEICKRGFRAISMHGNKSQHILDHVSNEFETNNYPILVATDIATHWLGVKDIKYVINYDYPNTSKGYINRINKTGHTVAGRTAITFFTPEKRRQAKDLIAILREANEVVNPKLLELSNMGKSNLSSCVHSQNRNNNNNNNYNSYTNSGDDNGGVKESGSSGNGNNNNYYCSSSSHHNSYQNDGEKGGSYDGGYKQHRNNQDQNYNNISYGGSGSNHRSESGTPKSNCRDGGGQSYLHHQKQQVELALYDNQQYTQWMLVVRSNFTIELYDFEDKKWCFIPKINRLISGIVTINGNVYAVGGDGAKTRNVDIFDIATNTWTPGVPMLTGNFGLGICVMNDKIYAIGGFHSYTKAERTATVFDPQTQHWNFISPMLSKRCFLSVAALNGLLYAVGGIKSVDSEEYLNTVEYYNPETDSWHSAPKMNSKRALANVGVLDGILYMVGGDHPNVGQITVEAYDPSLKRWTYVANTRKPRTRAGVVSYMGLLYLVGGFNKQLKKFESSIEIFNPLLNSWELLDNFTLQGNLGVRGITLIPKEIDNNFKFASW